MKWVAKKERSTLALCENCGTACAAYVTEDGDLMLERGPDCYRCGSSEFLEVEKGDIPASRRMRRQAKGAKTD